MVQWKQWLKKPKELIPGRERGSTFYIFENGEKVSQEILILLFLVRV